jgi:ribosomal protein S18 acetylase RimI-like enzyme
MTLEFIDSSHVLYQAVKKLGRKYAATLGFMPDGGFDDYADRRSIITASENGVLMGYLMFRQTTRHGRIAIVHLAIDEQYRHNGIYTKLLDALRERFQDSGDGAVSG